MTKLGTTNEIASEDAAAHGQSPASQRAQALIDWFAKHPNVVVAFSGGVDSSVVLAAAMRQAQSQVIAVTAQSPSVASWQLELARSIATQLGVDHQIILTREVELAEYAANDSRRCFYCKQTLYQTLRQHLPDCNGATIVSGTNHDDLGDYRPGIQAGSEQGVRTPLVELGFGKASVREIATFLGLPNSQLPASPCLASRIAYGVEVTPERLRRIDQAETLLRKRGFSKLRVRLHQGDLARIEVPAAEIQALTEDEVRSEIVTALGELGFRYVTLDLEGFSSGSMNRQLVPFPSQSSSDRKNG